MAYLYLLVPVWSIIRLPYKPFENKGKSIQIIYTTVISQNVYILCMVVFLVFKSSIQKPDDGPNRE
jgi:hypothetical protein